MARKKKYHPFRSMEEWVFQKFVDVLIEEGYILEAEYEPKTFNLTDGASYTFKEHKKTKVVDKTGLLFLKCSYTPDWFIKWAEKAKGVFIPREGENWKLYPFHDGGWLDVKGAGGFSRNNSSAISYPIKMKWLYDKFGIYSQKVVPQELFQKTFFPDDTIEHYTYKKGKNKGKFKFKVKVNFKDFINEIEKN